MEDYLAGLFDKFIAAIPNILVALLIVAFSVWLAHLLSGLLKRGLTRRHTDPGVTQLLAEIVRWTIVVLGVTTALQRFFNVTAFLAGLGIVGFTVGFALQNIMQNFVAGVILLAQQPFKVGDAISVAGYDGTVLAVNLRTTEMKTFDGRIVILPNADLLSNAIVNYTRADRRRVDLSVSIAKDADAESARRSVLEAIGNVPGFVPDPAPLVVFQSLGGSSMDLAAFFWVDISKTSPPAAKDAALLRIKKGFEDRGIDIPYPIQTILSSGEH